MNVEFILFSVTKSVLLQFNNPESGSFLLLVTKRCILSVRTSTITKEINLCNILAQNKISDTEISLRVLRITNSQKFF